MRCDSTMNIQFKKGVLEICVLALLDKQDRYGYELVQKISNQISISEGSVYPLLRRLTKEGYFTTYLQESTEGQIGRASCRERVEVAARAKVLGGTEELGRNANIH